MKILLLYAHDFWMRPYQKSLPDVPDRRDDIDAAEAVVALIHAEPPDRERQGKVVTKAIKHIKWVAGKFDSRRVVLHTFAHLASETASPEDARLLVDLMRRRLEGAGYEVVETPFGYFTEFRVHVAGPSLGKVFVEL